MFTELANQLYHCLQHILSELRERGVYVAHNVDATDLLLQRPTAAVPTEDSSADVSEGSVTGSHSDSGSSSGGVTAIQADVPAVNTAAAAVIASTPVDAIVFQFPHVSVSMSTFEALQLQYMLDRAALAFC
jgi:Domain of unknown function (DUF2431)